MVHDVENLILVSSLSVYDQAPRTLAVSPPHPFSTSLLVRLLLCNVLLSLSEALIRVLDLNTAVIASELPRLVYLHEF